MHRPLPFVSALVFSLCLLVPVSGDDRGSGKETKTGPLTFLGTVQGDLVKTSEGGYKIEVKYKDVVTATHGSSSQFAFNAARFRLPKTTTKEKNQELDLRVLPGITTIRLMNTDDKKADKDEQAKKAEKDAKDAAMKDQDDADEAAKKGKENTKPAKKKERTLPGVAGKAGDLKKGQVVIVTVAREDLPGFSRLVATSIYVLGEK